VRCLPGLLLLAAARSGADGREPPSAVATGSAPNRPRRDLA